MIDVIGKWIILAMQGNCLVEITHLPEKDVLLQSVLIRHKKHRYMTRPIRAVFFDSNSKLMYVILLFVWICFYFVVSNTPLYEDDFYFVFFSTPDDVNWYPYTQWFPSAYTERFSGVSRFVPHLMVALFDSVLSKTVFNLLASCSFMFLCYLMASTATDDKAKVPPLMILSAFLLWFVVPGFFQACLWKSGVCNYLFVGVLILLFYRSVTSVTHGRTSVFQCLLWALFGFVAGWTNEGFVVGLGAGLIAYFVSDFRKLDRRKCSMLIGFFAGAACLCLSPLNIYRFFHYNDVSGVVSSALSFLRSFIAMTDVRITLVLAAGMIFCVLAGGRRRSAMLGFLHENMILCVAVAVSFIFVTMTRHDSGHSRFPIEFYSTIIAIVLCNKLSISLLNKIGGGSSVLLLAGMIYVIPYSVRNHKDHENMKAGIEECRDFAVVENISVNEYLKRYIKPTMTTVYHIWNMNCGDLVKSYYNGSQNTVIVDSLVYRNILKHNREWTMMHFPSRGFSWIRVPADRKISKIVYNIRKTDVDSLPLFQRIIHHISHATRSPKWR